MDRDQLSVDPKTTWIPRESGHLEKRHVDPFSREDGGGVTPCGTTANDQDLDVLHKQFQKLVPTTGKNELHTDLWWG
jgi:hypothetical protein